MATQCSTTTPPARFLLLGDSHAGCVGRAAQTAELPFVGGPLGSGRDFLAPFFDTDGTGASHVGIATGPGSVISATTHGVMEHGISGDYWGARYVGARRVG